MLPPVRKIWRYNGQKLLLVEEKHMESKPKAVINNQYELLNTSTVGEFETQIQ